MCDRCLDIDYPVADCWRPCYRPSRRIHAIPTTPRGGFSEEDVPLQEKITRLLAALKQKQHEIATLKAVPLRNDPATRFEGVE